MSNPEVTFSAAIDAKAAERLMTNHPPFQNWLKGVEKLGAESVTVRDAVFFGPRPGFVFAEARVPDGEGGYHPGLTFIRGDAVAILVVMHPDFKGDFAKTAKSLLVHQTHVAIGEADCATIPAGMMDGSGHIRSKAIVELREETGLEIDEDQLIDLGHFYPSSGGCDEVIHLQATEIKLPQVEIDALHGKLTGLAEENEHIKLEVCNLTEAPQRSDANGINDMKSALAAMRYMQLRAESPKL